MENNLKQLPHGDFLRWSKSQLPSTQSFQFTNETSVVGLQSIVSISSHKSCPIGEGLDKSKERVDEFVANLDEVTFKLACLNKSVANYGISHKSIINSSIDCTCSSGANDSSNVIQGGFRLPSEDGQVYGIEHLVELGDKQEVSVHHLIISGEIVIKDCIVFEGRPTWVTVAQRQYSVSIT